jgi:hypothetical protein
MRNPDGINWTGAVLMKGARNAHFNSMLPAMDHKKGGNADEDN